ncbi:MAG: type II toxin-antitoxin system YoeB family toxin [Cyanobium sp. LacPavin_0920_WC12_MAG_63_22]|nr:type II toxin-antitoxin system YoeB family toxin [Cyanobium sp. LacPavin_0920_WC12_MAG_63_22]
MKAWPPPYEALVGDLSGAYSRRINIQHRLIYQVLDNERREYLSSLPGQIGMHD